MIKDKVSKQAIWKKMKSNQIEFLKMVLAHILSKKIQGKKRGKCSPSSKIKNIIIEDSTNIAVSEKLNKEYPGNCSGWNKEKAKAIMKLQVAYNITKKKFLRIATTSFRENDQNYSGAIMEIVEAGDLLLRDLGYFAIKVFRELTRAGVYYISKLRSGVNIYKEEEGEPIDLAEMLRKRGSLDIEVFIGAKEKMPTRLVAIPVDEQTANKRRRKAQSNRDKRCKPNKNSLYILGWEVFITNIKKEDVSSWDIGQLYFLRWRIEIIFKSWKSCFGIIDIPKDANIIRTESYIYSTLIFITLFQVYFYNNHLSNQPQKQTAKIQRHISILSLMQFIANNIEGMVFEKQRGLKNPKDFLLEFIDYHCHYDCRHDRVNFQQKLQLLS